jgi:hypothetical protein
MLRPLRIAVSVVSGVCCVLVIVLWVRSYFIAERLHLPIGSNKSIAFASKQGRFFVLSYLNVSQPNAWKTGLYRHSTTDEESFPSWDVADYSRLGFGILHEPPYTIPQLVQPVPGKPGYMVTWNGGVMMLKGFAVMFPAWFLTLLTAAIAFVPWMPIRRRFSLRTLLIATTAVAVLLGLIAWVIRR